ncbi:MAG: hypothetical protein A3F11_09030 [Gammaproteobacteria bacterium RIFCSPHIGHO2_12_FULL_37_14]|nr:MAG: hypothetical protein A3F11_09030 [Gammaproteobacteria bacterium RIFCSPHIGHO2_12_FULL_37_14]
MRIFIYILISLLLISCMNSQLPSRPKDLTHETWQRSITTTSAQWTTGADHWFYTGDPNGTEKINRQAPDSVGMSTTVVRVSDFTTIKTDGAYQLQLFGTDDRNSVYINGPNVAVNAVSVSIQDDTLVIRQTNKEISNSLMNGVIVRVGVNQLHKLIQKGCGTVEAIRIQSDHLAITSTATAMGNVYLIGNVNLKRIVLNGTGSVTVLGASSPNLVIHTKGSGAVNVKGNVGIQSIVHHGQSDINILGANSNKLDIDADGAGKISIKGIVKLNHLTAKDDVCIYIDEVRSQCVEANLSGNVRVGLKGLTKDLYVNTIGTSIFWGRYLCSRNAYVTACNQSHINVAACGKIFASAVDQASVYFYGPSNILSEFTKDEGSVIAMGDQTWCTYGTESRSYSYTDAHKGEAVAVYQEVDLSARYPSHRHSSKRANAMNYIK